MRWKISNFQIQKKKYVIITTQDYKMISMKNSMFDIIRLLQQHNRYMMSNMSSNEKFLVFYFFPRIVSFIYFFIILSKMSSVKLHVYDLSGGLASALSESLIGKKIDGIWYYHLFHIFRIHFNNLQGTLVLLLLVMNGFGVEFLLEKLL